MSRRIPGLLFLFFACVMVAGEETAVPVTGQEVPELKPFDELFLSFMASHKLPGVSVAVTRQGQLVYARGFGYSELENKIPVQPNALFRIASISKPITAVAIMQLVEAGSLKLEDKAFALLGLNPGEKGDARLKDITILQLLQHTAGWDRDKTFDPMFYSAQICRELKVTPPAKPADIITYMLNEKLTTDPGSTYSYSNFGYCVLGRIIEKVSGRTYEDYVKEKVLQPLGISHMRLGKSRLEDRAPDEVRYYTEKNTTKADARIPYATFCVESMDAHGGWIASASDLARFCAAFDVPENCKILKASSIQTMFARPAGLPGADENGKPRAAYYGCGWSVRPVGKAGKANTWHNGSLPGTSTLMVHRADGLCWTVLFNSRANASGQEPAGEIDALMHRAADAVKVWPATGLK